MTDIHKDKEAMKAIAVLQAIEHRCNYNLIIHNHVNGNFDEDRSTYEVVADSWFEKDRPHAIILYTTDDMRQNLADHFDEAMVRVIEKKQEEMDGVKEKSVDYAKALENPPFKIERPPADLYDKIEVESPKPFIANKVPGRNDPCSCGSGKKAKKCCFQ